MKATPPRERPGMSKASLILLCDICRARETCKHLRSSNPTGELCDPMESIIATPAFEWPRERYLEDMKGKRGKHRPCDEDDADMAVEGISIGKFQTILDASLSEDHNEYEPDVNCRSYLDEYREDQDAKAQEHISMHNDILDLPHGSFVEARKKVIAAAAFFNVPIEMISLVLKAHESTVRRTAKRGVHPAKIIISDG